MGHDVLELVVRGGLLLDPLLSVPLAMSPGLASVRARHVDESGGNEKGHGDR
jgi:hypothetical protein